MFPPRREDKPLWTIWESSKKGQATVIRLNYTQNYRLPWACHNKTEEQGLNNKTNWQIT